MKKLYYILPLFLLAACDNLDLPDVNVEKDLFNIPLPATDEGLIEVELKPETEPMKHGGEYGSLVTDADIERIKTNLNREPWKSGYEKLCSSRYATGGHTPRPQEYIIRGVAGENAVIAGRDLAAAFQCGLRWRIEGKIDKTDNFGDKAIEILNLWVKTCKGTGGNSNAYLASGLYGYQFAVIGELMRNYPGWTGVEFAAYQKWLIDAFYGGNKDFLIRRNGTNADHYWANWPLCNIASMLAIGITSDRRDIYNEALTHLQIGEMNGRITHAINHVFDGEYANMAQWQEMGRDQGHTLLGIGLMGTIFQMAWNQGDDFFAYQDNIFLKACEHVSRYNYTTLECPFATYQRGFTNQWQSITYETYTTFGETGRGNDNPVWALPYYHYAKVKNVAEDKFPCTKVASDRMFPEGGAGTSSGAENTGTFDSMGFGTLLYARD